MQKKQPLQGGVWSFITEDGKRGAMVELFCQTDFAARTDEFKEGAQLIAQGLTLGKTAHIKPITDALEEKLKEPVILGRYEVFDMRD
jgi:translation elongation factor EF-Ts